MTPGGRQPRPRLPHRSHAGGLRPRRGRRVRRPRHRCPGRAGRGALAYAREDRGARVQGRPNARGLLDGRRRRLARRRCGRTAAATFSDCCAAGRETCRASTPGADVRAAIPTAIRTASPGAAYGRHEPSRRTNMPVCRPLPLPPPWPSRLPPWRRHLRHPLRRMRGSSPNRRTTAGPAVAGTRVPGPSPRCPPRRPG